MRTSIDNVNHMDKALPRSEGGVLELIHAVMHRYRSQQYRALRGGPHADVTHMDSKVLAYFGRNAGATQSDLAQHSGRDKAQLARLIKGLRERGLLAAEVDEADRRNVRLSLTPEGSAIQRSLQRQARRLSEQAVAGFSDEERAQLAGLLQRVNDNLQRSD
jgi:DNA-binding MarR family transcriptional regulator